MKKIIPLLVVLLVGITFEGRTIVGENAYKLETVSALVYTKAEIDELISNINTKITANKNEIDSLKTSLNGIKTSLNEYAKKSELTTLQNNINTLKSIADNNTARIEELENRPVVTEPERYYLYKDGDEMTSVTGGWGCNVGINSTASSCETSAYGGENTWLKRFDDHMQFYTNWTGSIYPYYFPKKTINFSEYKYLAIEYDEYNSNDTMKGGMIVSQTSSLSTSNSNPYMSESVYAGTAITSYKMDRKVVQYFPIVNNSNAYLLMRFSHYYSGSYFNIYKIWLEK